MAHQKYFIRPITMGTNNQKTNQNSHQLPVTCSKGKKREIDFRLFVIGLKTGVIFLTNYEHINHNCIITFNSHSKRRWLANTRAWWVKIDKLENLESGIPVEFRWNFSESVFCQFEAIEEFLKNYFFIIISFFIYSIILL